MGLAPGAKLTFSTLRDLPKMTLPVEALEGALQTAQSTKDTADLVLSKLPETLNTPAFQNVRSQVAAYRDQLREKLINAAETGDVSNYLGSLSQASMLYADLYQPGNVGHTLESAYKNYLKASQDIKDFTKDFTDPNYRMYFEDQLMSQVAGITEEDLLVGNASIGTPNLFKEYDVIKEMDSFLKNFLQEQDVDFTPFVDPATGRVDITKVIKHTKKYIDPVKLEQSVNNFLNSPRAQQAIMVQKHALAKAMPDEESRIEFVSTVKQQLDSEIEQSISPYKSILENIDQIKSSQVSAYATSLGLGSDIKTKGQLKSALEKKVGEFEAQKQQVLQSIDLNDALEYSVKKTYRDTVIPKYLGVQEDKDVIQDQLAIARYKANRMIQFYSQFIPKPDAPLVVPEGAGKKKIGGLSNVAQEAKEARLQGVETIRNTPYGEDLIKAIGVDEKGEMSGDYGVTISNRIVALSNLMAQAARMNQDGSNPQAIKEYLKENAHTVLDGPAQQKFIEFLDSEKGDYFVRNNGLAVMNARVLFEQANERDNIVASVVDKVTRKVQSDMDIFKSDVPDDLFIEYRNKYPQLRKYITSAPKGSGSYSKELEYYFDKESFYRDLQTDPSLNTILADVLMSNPEVSQKIGIDPFPEVVVPRYAVTSEDIEPELEAMKNAVQHSDFTYLVNLNSPLNAHLRNYDVEDPEQLKNIQDLEFVIEQTPSGVRPLLRATSKVGDQNVVFYIDPESEAALKHNIDNILVNTAQGLVDIENNVPKITDRATFNNLASAYFATKYGDSVNLNVGVLYSGISDLAQSDDTYKTLSRFYLDMGNQKAAYDVRLYKAAGNDFYLVSAPTTMASQFDPDNPQKLAQMGGDVVHVKGNDPNSIATAINSLYANMGNGMLMEKAIMEGKLKTTNKPPALPINMLLGMPQF